MIRLKYAQALAYIIILFSILVITGWIFDIANLITLWLHWIPIKFISAVCFVFSGIMLLIISRLSVKKTNIAFLQIILPLVSLVILLIIVPLIFSIIFNLNIVVENFFVVETNAATYTAHPGEPSIATIINFILIAILGLLEAANFYKKKTWLYLISFLVIAVSLTCLVGYALHLPWLFFYFPGKSSAMSPFAAYLFILWSIGVTLCTGVKNGEK